MLIFVNIVQNLPWSSLCNFVSRLRATSSSWRIWKIYIFFYSLFKASHIDVETKKLNSPLQLYQGFPAWSLVNNQFNLLRQRPQEMPSHGPVNTIPFFSHIIMFPHSFWNLWTSTKQQPTLISCVSQTGSAHLWDFIKWFASNTVPRNVNDFPTLWRRQKIIIQMINMMKCWPDWQEHSNQDDPSLTPCSCKLYYHYYKYPANHPSWLFSTGSCIYLHIHPWVFWAMIEN